MYTARFIFASPNKISLEGVKLESSQGLLENFKKGFFAEYDGTEMCSVLASKRHIFTDEKMPAVFYKYERAPKAVNKAEGEFLETIKYASRNVTPVQIGGVFNLGEGSIENRYLPVEMARYFVEEEYKAVIAGLQSYAGINVNVRKKGVLSIDDVWKAFFEHARKGANADSIVVSLKQKTQLLIDGKILPPRFRSSDPNTEKIPMYYAGQIGTINTYWARFIEDFSLVFEREEILIHRTPLEISFDMQETPKLTIKEWFACAPTFDEAVAKINL
jgi:hypothetical protein